MATEPIQEKSDALVPGSGTQPSGTPTDEMVRSAAVGDEDLRVDQENGAGKDDIRGGGEFPDPETEPDYAAGAPGPELVRPRDHGQGQFDVAPPEPT